MTWLYCCRIACVNSKWLENLKYQSHTFWYWLKWVTLNGIAVSLSFLTTLYTDHPVTTWTTQQSTMVGVMGDPGFSILDSIDIHVITLTDHAALPKISNTLRPRQDGRHYNIFKCIFLNENVWISIKIKLKYVLKIHWSLFLRVKLTTFQLVGGKPLSEPMMVRLPTHLCVTQPQWV